ncbi:MAG: hypothetical protein ACKOLA_03550, partial [Spartobacteria bacterium]
AMNPVWNKPLAWLVDGAMCNMMHVLQWRRRADACSCEELDNYIARHAPMTREEFYRMPAAARPSLKNGWIEGDTPTPPATRKTTAPAFVFSLPATKTPRPFSSSTPS